MIWLKDIKYDDGGRISWWCNAGDDEDSYAEFAQSTVVYLAYFALQCNVLGCIVTCGRTTAREQNPLPRKAEQRFSATLAAATFSLQYFYQNGNISLLGIFLFVYKRSLFFGMEYFYR